MSTPRFLLLEDKPLDTEAIQTTLTDGGIGCELSRVDTRADFVTALETVEFDLILAAYAMPGFDGISALKIARNLRPDVPFIFVSASLGEELAIETLKQGATDYVLKQRLERLVPSVQRALREAQERRDRKQTEQLLIEQKQLLELIASGHPLDECLAAVCTSISRLNSAHACFLLTDAQRQTFPRSITPDLPPSFGQGLKDAPINDLCIGTCGEAVYRSEPITCADIANDDRWSQAWRDLCIAHGILACHSKPVMGSDGLPLGSLMLCFDEARMPTAWEYQLAEFGTQIASIAFERDRSSLTSYHSEERYRLLTSILTSIVWTVDPEGAFVSPQPEWETYTGQTWEEYQGLGWVQALHPDDREPLLARWLQAKEQRTIYRSEGRMWHAASGAYHYFEARGVPLFNLNGSVREWIGTITDVHDRQQTEDALRDSESRFRLMVESAREYAIFTTDLDGVITSWNSGAERLLGYQDAEIIGRDGRILYTPEDNEQRRADREMQTAQMQGRAVNECWHVRQDGSCFWGSGLVMPLQTEAGNAQGFVKILQDKTAQRQANERFQLLYDTTSDLLATEQPLALMHNLFSKLSAQLELDYYYNYMVEEKHDRQMLHLRNYEGLSDAEAPSIAWIEFGQYLCGLVAQEKRQIVLDQTQLSTYSSARLLCLLGVTAYAGQPLIVQGRLLGTLSFASRTRTHFTPEEANLLQSVCDQMAIALERTNLLNSIQQQAAQLQRANRIKDEFLAVLSHELRSPLNPILGWTRLLQNGKLDEARRAEALKTIERNAKLQTQLIEDLLDISRIMQGKLSLTAAPVSLTFVDFRRR